MKILRKPKPNYWVGAKGECSSCGTKVELEKADTVRPYRAAYEDFKADGSMQPYMHHTISMDVICPTCLKNIHITKEVEYE